MGFLKYKSNILLALVGVAAVLMILFWKTSRTPVEPKMQDLPFKPEISSQDAQKILILGDSLTVGYGVSSSQAFPARLEILLQKEFPDKNIQVISAGISGSTSASAPSRMEKLWKKHKPHILFLALGANDGLRRLPVSSMKTNLKTTIHQAMQKNMKVILAGMKAPFHYGPHYRKSFENTFKELAKEHGIDIMPFLLKDVAAKPDLNLPDGIHPNPNGYKIIAQNVFPYFKKYYE